MLPPAFKLCLGWQWKDSIPLPESCPMDTCQVTFPKPQFWSHLYLVLVASSSFPIAWSPIFLACPRGPLWFTIILTFQLYLLVPFVQQTHSSPHLPAPAVHPVWGHFLVHLFVVSACPWKLCSNVTTSTKPPFFSSHKNLCHCFCGTQPPLLLWPLVLSP